MDVVDCGVGVLVVHDVNAPHGKQGQLVGALGEPSVLHVAGDREQLCGVHDVFGRVNNNLVGRLKGHWVFLAQGEGAEGAVRGVLRGTL